MVSYMLSIKPNIVTEKTQDCLSMVTSIFQMDVTKAKNATLISFSMDVVEQQQLLAHTE